MKKILLSMATIFGAFIFANAQINVAVTSGPSQMLEDGTLSEPMVFTVSNIPMGLETNGAVGINSRAYPDGAGVTGGGHVGQYGNVNQFTLFDTKPDVNNVNIKTVTTLDTPTAGFFTRVFTIKKYGPVAASTGDVLDFTFRVIGIDQPSPVLTFDPVQEAGGPATRAILRISQDVIVTATLSTSNKINISDSIYPNPVSSVLNINNSIETKNYKVVNLLGSVVKESPATGSLDVSELPKGLYVLVTDKGTAKFVKK